MSFLSRLLQGATQIAEQYFGKVAGITKENDNNQVLTAADLAIGKFISQVLEQNYPDHNLIDEETGALNKESKYTWVIDPIGRSADWRRG